MSMCFVYGDFVLEPCNVVYYGCNEEFVWVSVLGVHALDEVVYKIYIVEVKVSNL
jgi:hypothetical protein